MTRQPIRITLIALMAALSVAVLAACGGGATASQPQAAAQPAAKSPTAQAPAAAQPAAKDAVDFADVAKSNDKLFVSVDDVKKAFDAKQDFILVDARPPSDFAVEHIVGAVNVPYFEVDKHLSKLPKDKWIVTYCACPHAEAEEAARQLTKNGYTKVKVMDEGYFGWVDKKYPIEKKNG